MLLIRELARIFLQVMAFSVTGRRWGLLVVVTAGLVVAVASSLATTLGPVVIYPFL